MKICFDKRLLGGSSKRICYLNPVNNDHLHPNNCSVTIFTCFSFLSRPIVLSMFLLGTTFREVTVFCFNFFLIYLFLFILLFTHLL